MNTTTRERDDGAEEPWRDEEQRLNAVLSLCARLTPGQAEAPELERLLYGLAASAGPDGRARLEAALAQAPWAPPDLLARLRVEDARRLDLTPDVATALADARDPLVAAALAGNTAVPLPHAALDALADLARHHAGVREALARRLDLQPAQAAVLARSGSPGLRARLSARFSRAELAAEGCDDLEQVEAAQGEQRFADKLLATGRLQPGYLVRVLREGRMGLFEAGLAALAGFEREDAARAVQGGPGRLAAAVRAVGLDRSVFPTVLTLVRRLTGGRPADRPGAASAVAAALAASPEAAARSFLDDLRADGEA